MQFLPPQVRVGAFLLVAGVLLVDGATAVQRYTWQAVPGELVSVGGERRRRQTLDAHWRYTVNGQGYEERYTGGPFLGATRTSNRVIVAPVPSPAPAVGRVTVYVSRLDPRLSALQRGPTVFSWGLLALLGLLFGADRVLALMKGDDDLPPSD